MALRELPPRMRLLAVPALLLLLAGSSDCGGNTSSGGSAPASLASTCTNVCNNVLGQCGTAGALGSCVQACQGLNGVQGACVDQLASYLGCVSNAASLTCSGTGATLSVQAPSCNSQYQAYAVCGGGILPSVSACVGLSSANSTCT